MRKEINLDKATCLINHGPVILVSSLYGGKMNVTPIAWNMPVQKDPPMIVLEVSETHFIYECIMESGDFVVNIPSSSMAEEVVNCGSVSGRDVDKASVYGLEEEASNKIKSPALKKAMGILECVLVKDEHLLKEYNMVVGSVKYAAAEEEFFSDHWLFGKGDLKTIHHLGNKTFCSPGSEIIDLREEI